MSSTLKPIAVAVTLIGCLCSPAMAQRPRIEFTPFAGGFIPTSSLGTLRVSGIGGQTVTAKGEMETAGVLGARVSVGGVGRWAVEGSYFFSGSDLRVTAGPFVQTIAAELQGGSLKATYRATNEQSGTDLFLSGGIGGIQHSGNAFRFASEQFDIGGLVGAGLHITLSSQVTLRFDGDIMFYQWSAGPTFGKTTQSDIILTAGLGLKLGR